MKLLFCVLAVLLSLCMGNARFQAAVSNSISRVWNERAIAGIRIDRPHPRVQARICFTLLPNIVAIRSN